MNERLFSANIVSGAVGPGLVTELVVSPNNKNRLVWCFFNNASLGAGDGAWIRFYLNGELTSEIPAVLWLSSVLNVGMATSNAVFLATGSTAPGPQTLFFANGDPGVTFYTVQPFRIFCEADLVRLEQTKAGTVSAMLAVMSTEQPA